MLTKKVVQILSNAKKHFQHNITTGSRDIECVIIIYLITMYIFWKFRTLAGKHSLQNSP